MTKEQIMALSNESVFGNNLYKYVEFSSWFNWYPDLFLDLITPESGGIKLHSDQRVYLRSIMRFVSTYGVFPRGWGKTFDEVLAMFLVGMRFSDIDLALTAQTKENAAELLRDKTLEIIKYYPMLENELEGSSIKNGTRFSRNDAEVRLKSGARIDVLANAQTSKGQRRKRINIEEAALLNDVMFQDALKPIVEVPRYTVGKLGVVDPQELNQQINFFTTSGFRGSDEYQRSIAMLKGMIELSGEMILGSSWFLACWYGRGSTKSQILKKKKEMSPIAFAQNYESKWVGCADSALVNINKLMSCRSLTSTQKESRSGEEFYLGVDVARSQNTNNNQSSVCVAKVKRNKDKTKIVSIDIVNIINIPNIMNFTAQACIIKKIRKRYNAQAVVIDGNGLGAGLIDECLKESFDPITNESLGCWDTINDDNIPELPDESEKILYNLKAQSVQSRVVTNFIDMVDSGKLRLLCNKQLNDFTVAEQDDFDNEVAPFMQTDCLFEEVANLKLKQLPNGGVTIEKVVKKLDKDRVSATIYVLWYINEFCRDLYSSSDYDYEVLIN